MTAAEERDRAIFERNVGKMRIFAAYEREREAMEAELPHDLTMEDADAPVLPTCRKRIEYGVVDGTDALAPWSPRKDPLRYEVQAVYCEREAGHTGDHIARLPNGKSIRLAPRRP